MFKFPTRLPPALNGIAKGTFVYKTITDRWPKIICKVINRVECERQSHVALHHSEGEEDINSVINQLSKLTEHIKTNKSLEDIDDKLDYMDVWNEELKTLRSYAPENVTWFKANWILVECYLYRRINGIFSKTSTLDEFDPFEEEKKKIFHDDISNIEAIGKFLEEGLVCSDDSGINAALDNLLKMSLWGNTCDMSLSLGEVPSLKNALFHMVNSLSDKILCDESEQGLNAIRSATGRHVDIVLDNCGTELFSDLAFADFLVSKMEIKAVIFHGKQMPWFVSDVTKPDLDWVLNDLSTQQNETLRHLGRKWQQFFSDKKFVYMDHEFWTFPFVYSNMDKNSPDLYEELSSSALIIMKGDLNYRKLVGDLKWEYNTPMEVAIQEFSAAPVLALRTLKSETVAGLDQKAIDYVRNKYGKSEAWMTTGDYAVIQYVLPQHTIF